MPASLAFLSKISCGGKCVADFCLPQRALSPAFQACSQGFGWNLAAFPAAWVKPSAETWLGRSWRWKKVSHQFVLLLSVWAGYLPTQVTIMCRSLKFGNCRQGGAEWQSNAGITEKSPASMKLLLRQGVRACSRCFAGTFPSCTPQPCPAFWTKPAWSQFNLVPSSLWGFEAMSEELHELMKLVQCFLAAPAFTCTPRGLPAPSPSCSVPPPSPSCQGSLLPLSQSGAKAFVF